MAKENLTFEEVDKLIRSERMAISNRFLQISSICKFFVLLTLTLLLISPSVVNAQENANSANSNTGNTNINANRNSNANANANANANQSDNVKGDSNQRGSGTDPRAEARKDKLAESPWFLLIVTALFAAVLIPFALTIVRVVRFSRASFSSPLGLPEGSLRAMVAYTLVAFLGFYIYASILSLTDFKPPDFLLGIVATVVGFYFGSRTSDDRDASTAIPRTGTIQGNVTDKTGAPAGGANVELHQSDGKNVLQKANDKGEYKFDNVPVGDCEIKASLEGQAPSDPAKVKVVKGPPHNVNLKLK